MQQRVTINLLRPGKGITCFSADLIEATPGRLKTISMIPRDTSLRWCEDTWWRLGLVPQGVLIGSEIRYFFHKEWFSVMQLCGITGDHLGYYVDINTPVRKVTGELYLTDLFVDLWLPAGGDLLELDRDEFEHAYQTQLVTPYQYKKANKVVEMLIGSIKSREFFQLLM